MIQKLTKLTAAASTILTLLLTVVFPLTVHASTGAKFYLSPASDSITKGSSLTLNVMLDTGGNSVTAWKAALNYSTSYFSSLSVSNASSSPFTMNPNPNDTPASGIIRISRFNSTPTAYSGPVATITLKSSGTIGSTAISFVHCVDPSEDYCSIVPLYDGTNHPPDILGTITGGSYTVVNPPTPASSGSSSGGKSKSKAKSSTVATTAPTPTPPTPSPASTTTKQVTSQKKTVDITFKVLDQDGKPVEGASVKFGNQTKQTDPNGQVTFYSVSTGSKSGTVSYKGKISPVTVQLDDSSGIATKTINIQVKKASAVVPISLSLLAALIVGASAFVFMRKSKNPLQQNGQVFTPTPQDSEEIN